MIKNQNFSVNTYKQILFVCVENAGRSQMAEAFLKNLAAINCQVISAGTQPSTKINPTVVDAMKEIGIDISTQTPKLLSNEMLKQSKVINMGCMDKESCPTLFVNDIIEWQIPDPKGKSIEEVRKIRDTIQSNVEKLVLQLQEEE